MKPTFCCHCGRRVSFTERTEPIGDYTTWRTLDGNPVCPVGQWHSPEPERVAA